MDNHNFKFRSNIMKIDSIKAFYNIRGTRNEQAVDAYFIRALGVSAFLAQDIKTLEKAYLNSLDKHMLYYNRLTQVLQAPDIEASAYYIKCYELYKSMNESRIESKFSKSDDRLAVNLAYAFKKSVILNAGGNVALSESMIRNLFVKFIYRFDTVFDGLKGDFYGLRNIKLVFESAEKRQDYLFALFLHNLGIDVLVLMPKSDIELEEELKKLSQSFVQGAYAELKLDKFTLDAAKETAKEEDKKIVISIPRREEFKPKTSSQAIRVQPVRESAPVKTQPVNIQRSAQAFVPASQSTAKREKTPEELARLASSVVMISLINNKKEIVGSGSGIMIGSDGYILTNQHVASGGLVYAVQIEDDEKIYYTDALIKYNQRLDLAIIRIDRSLNPLPVYDSNQSLVRGQKVIAIGSPLGLFNSVSDGIISGFRKIQDVNMIQFTAPISHGSSGGALLNMSGEVIGISTAGIDNGQNINLAVPYDSISSFIRGFTN